MFRPQHFCLEVGIPGGQLKPLGFLQVQTALTVLILRIR